MDFQSQGQILNSPMRRPSRTINTPQLQSALPAFPTSAERISARINEVIESSRSILDLEEDWDEQGSPGYKESTWSRATNFVKDLALANRGIGIGGWVDPPRILPGPEGSIDIHWKTSKRELLINISDDDEEPADFYGCGNSNDTIKGKLDTSLPNEWILMWLTR